MEELAALALQLGPRLQQVGSPFAGLRSKPTIHVPAVHPAWRE